MFPFIKLLFIFGLVGINGLKLLTEIFVHRMKIKKTGLKPNLSSILIVILCYSSLQFLELKVVKS